VLRLVVLNGDVVFDYVVLITTHASWGSAHTRLRNQTCWQWMWGAIANYLVNGLIVYDPAAGVVMVGAYATRTKRTIAGQWLVLWLVLWRSGD
jgi:hypothetical protein